ncbi:MAG: serine hydrolase domain-containing protein [Deltaproteobacteria bacterium]|nr:serine hydrolase domain-containing protein [Deltaproteobacteria bacterium]
MSGTTIDQEMEAAVESGVFPAASLLVAKEGQILHHNHYGKARTGTFFDIASLTKPLSTATLAMQLVQEDLLKLDDTVYQWLGGARLPAHRKMTVTHLLSHTSGLPAWHPFYRELPIDQVGTAAGRQHILASCLQEPVLSEPGTQCVYSDLGYILLGEILEQTGLVPLDLLFQNRVAKPLGLKETFFVRIMGAKDSDIGHRTPTFGGQASNIESTHRRFAPTEDCPWRGRVIRGEVHDQNAYAMGGVAGHAGLFSTAEDLHKFIAELSKCYHGKSDWISQNIVKDFLDYDVRSPMSAERSYTLGWDTPTPGQSSSGGHFSPHSIGHLGYTGCSMWIDLDKNFWVILLTNRIHPSTLNEKIKAFRPQIHNLIWKELIGQ